MHVWVRIHGELSEWDYITIPTPWQSSEGYRIESHGNELTVEWEGEADDWGGAAGRAREWAADLLAVLAVEAWPVRVRWTAQLEYRVDGGDIQEQGGALGGGGGYSPGDEVLQRAAQDAVRLRDEGTARAALRLYERAALLMSVDRQAAMSLAYLSAEMTLTEMAGGGTWDAGAKVLGLGSDDATQLWASYQFFRHGALRTAKANRRLIEIDRPPLTESECLDGTKAVLLRRILVATAGSNAGEQTPAQAPD